MEQMERRCPRSSESRRSDTHKWNNSSFQSAETAKMYGDMTKSKANMFEMNNFNPIGAYFVSSISK